MLLGSMDWETLLNNPPLIVCAVPITEPKPFKPPDGCEAVELRLDYLRGLERRVDEVKGLVKVMASQYPVIVTVRDVEEGGVFKVDNHVKLDILEYAKMQGAMVDVEARHVISGELANVAGGSIVSRHVYTKATDLEGTALRDIEYALRHGALVYKLFSAFNSDYLTLLKLLMLKDSYGLRIAVIPMDPLYRAASMILGTALMYCSVTGQTAPGQLGLDQCIRVKELRRSVLKAS